jgi:hypothetical protein
MDPDAGGRRRYLAFLLEGLTPTGAQPLPTPAAPLQKHGNWPR